MDEDKPSGLKENALVYLFRFVFGFLLGLASVVSLRYVWRPLSFKIDLVTAFICGIAAMIWGDRLLWLLLDSINSRRSRY